MSSMTHPHPFVLQVGKGGATTKFGGNTTIDREHKERVEAERND